MPSYDLTFKVLLLGDPSTGKEEFVIRYTSGFFLEDTNLTFVFKIIKKYNKI